MQLDLSDNGIGSGLDALIGCPELEHISLSGNPIKELTSLEPLVSLSLSSIHYLPNHQVYVVVALTSSLLYVTLKYAVKHTCAHEIK